MLREQAWRQPARIALRQKRLRHLAADRLGHVLAARLPGGAGLRAAGLEPAAAGAIIAENRLEWLLAQMGAGVLGAIPVGVYCTSPAAEVGYVLEHAEVDMVV